jgi:hypothetical protein
VEEPRSAYRSILDRTSALVSLLHAPEARRLVLSHARPVSLLHASLRRVGWSSGHGFAGASSLLFLAKVITTTARFFVKVIKFFVNIVKFFVKVAIWSRSVKVVLTRAAASSLRVEAGVPSLLR